MQPERPRRLQRKRTKGWRMPEGAIYVGRPTSWGNSAKAGDCLDCRWGDHDGEHRRVWAKGPHRHGRYGHDHHLLTRGQWFAHLTAEHGLPEVSR